MNLVFDRGLFIVEREINERNKYKQMYSLSDHEAAALVIARRAAGFNERKDFSACLVTKQAKKVTKASLTSNTLKVPKKGMKPNLEQVRLAGRGFSMTVKPKSWLWLRKFLKPYPSSQDPLWYRVNNHTYPAYSGMVSGVESAGNRESRDSQQVDHATLQLNEVCMEAK